MEERENNNPNLEQSEIHSEILSVEDVLFSADISNYCYALIGKLTDMELSIPEGKEIIMYLLESLRTFEANRDKLLPFSKDGEYYLMNDKALSIPDSDDKDVILGCFELLGLARSRIREYINDHPIFENSKSIATQAEEYIAQAKEDKQRLKREFLESNIEAIDNFREEAAYSKEGINQSSEVIMPLSVINKALGKEDKSINAKNNETSSEGVMDILIKEIAPSALDIPEPPEPPVVVSELEQEPKPLEETVNKITISVDDSVEFDSPRQYQQYEEGPINFKPVSLTDSSEYIECNNDKKMTTLERDALILDVISLMYPDGIEYVSAMELKGRLESFNNEELKALKLSYQQTSANNNYGKNK